jgi:SanA protein
MVRFLRLMSILLALAIIWAIYAYLDVSLRYRSRILSPEQLDHRPVALVLGAGVYPDGRLSAMLADRVLTAVDLYKQGKVDKLLMSGDNSIATYNEPWHMADYAIARGVPEEAIAFDYAGRRTYASCWRAKHIFGLDRVVVITQRFHLPRALYLCQSVGLDAVGVAADRRDYRLANTRYSIREIPARIRAWLDVHILHPPVVGGDPIDIFSPDYKGRYE